MKATHLALVAVVAGLLLLAAPAAAQEGGQTTITGRIEHGLNAPGFDPTQLAVTLNVLEGISAFDQETATPDESGNFSFDVVNAKTRSYFLGVEYQGARYSETRTSLELGEPVVIRVFDTTHDTSVLEFESYTVLVAGAVADEGWIEVLERASVHNNSDMTLTPDPSAEGPGMLSFLRFALPPGAYNLDVRSNLVGGDILEVDRGFGLTTPVTPTEGEPHLFEFVYRLDYDEPMLDLSRTMRFGADTFRYVAAAEVGRPVSERLEDLGATELNGRFLRLLEGNNVEPGEVVFLSITELPMPSIWANAGKLASEWYVRAVVPAIIVAALVAVFAFLILSRRALPTMGPGSDPEQTRDRLLQLAESLEERWHAGKVSARRYRRERDDLKQALVDVRLRAQIAADDQPSK